MRLRAALGCAVVLGLAGCAAEETTPAAAPPNVLFVTIDTLRADYLGAYGFPHPTSPHLDALAAEGVLFERAIAGASMTAPSHASMFTSRYTRGHSVGYLNGLTRLEGEPTLAERFREGGYATGAFVSNMVLGSRSGFGRGFERYDESFTAPERNRSGVLERTAEATTDAALEWLAARDARPFLLWVHYQDPHGPYTPPPETRGRIRVPPVSSDAPLPVLGNDSGFRGIPAYQALEGKSLPSEYRGLYGDEILAADRGFGRLRAAFERASGERPTVVLVTSDHGETLGEHDFWFVHAFSAMPELAHVPFLLKAPGLRPERRAEVVSHVDVLPTLLDLAGLPPVARPDGIALAPYLREARPLPGRRVYCDIGRELAAYEQGGFVRVSGIPSAWEAPGAAGASDAAWEHYRWDAMGISRADPAGISRAPIEAYIDATVPMRDNGVSLESDELEALRALGYVDTASDP